jgi:hypothetical protein
MSKTRESEIVSLRSEIARAEKSAQSAAFNSLSETGSYELSEKLLEVARDLHAVGKRVDQLAAMERSPGRVSGDLGRGADVVGRRRGKSSYPRFEIGDDRIVKIGKGKAKASKEYRHEASRESFERLMSWLDAISGSGKKEWLAQEAVEGVAGEVPSYQVYLMLGALRIGGLLRSVRKGSYELADSTVAVSDYWDVLRARIGRDRGEEQK